MLSSEQVDKFRRDGFLVIDDVFTGAEMKAAEAAIDSAAIQTELQLRGAAENGAHLFELTVRHPLFRQLAADNRVVERVASLVGEDIQLHHSKLAVQPWARPGHGGFEWHQDFTYLPHTNTDLVAVMVMVDEATPSNGCMYALPGSHLMGLLPYDPGTGYCRSPEPGKTVDGSVAITPRVGGISIHHVLTVHHSPINLSGQPRRGMVFQYRNSDAHQIAEKYFADTGYQVRGEYRGQVRCTEGTYPLRWDRFRGFGPAWTQVGEMARRWNEEERFARSRSWSPFSRVTTSESNDVEASDVAPLTNEGPRYPRYP